MRTRFLLIGFIAALLFAVACGDDSLAYQPAAYGQQVQFQPGQTYQAATAGGFQTVTVQQPQDSWICWIASDYHEAALLAASGACPNSWVPILMASLNQGLLWHEMYAPYYDGAGYYGRYVPLAYRSTYVSNVTVFETHYHTQITAAESSSSARWKGSDGKTYSGTTVGQSIKSGKASFSSGSARSSSFASGSARSSSTTRTPSSTGYTRSSSSSFGSASRAGSSGFASGSGRR